ncbi:MAG: IPExxxVDY family protein [Flavobacteriaceae bacterium]|jgi:hypothetical protein|nr:IPExxxVDY family protein [Flavobacteriaceae bacterium]
MAVHKLVLDDFVDADYSLFAIHCDLEDYRLAFYINHAFKTNLKRAKEDVDFKGSNASFSLFEWENTNLKTTWNLIKNTCLVEDRSIDQGLFAERSEKNWKTHYLLEEHPVVGYFLKISGGNNTIEKTVLELQKIPAINMTYVIDVEELKSKDYLILN